MRGSEGKCRGTRTLEFILDMLHLRDLSGCPAGMLIMCVYSWEDVRTREQVLAESLEGGEITMKTEMGSFLAVIGPSSLSGGRRHLPSFGEEGEWEIRSKKTPAILPS